MMLCLDVGNSHIYGGVFDGDTLCLRFRCSSQAGTSDELGVFLKNALRENGCNPSDIHQIAICSVVPQLDYSLRSACIKYFSKDPFVLQPGVKTGLNIKYRNPLEVGADRIANAIAGAARYPNQNKIIIDFGTASTFCAVSAQNVYFGGAILPGVRLSTDALSMNTAKLPRVEIIKMEQALGRSTTESIQSGVFFGILGACKEIVSRLKQECFKEEPALVLATGGFSSLFEQHDLFDVLLPDLVLEGIKIAALMNASKI